jgi:predicted transposase YbfD/YdcC
MEANTDNFFDHFEDLKDPRIDRTKLHRMDEIIFLTMCAIISDCDSWIDIEDYGKSHIQYLRKFLPYKNGIPSDDTLRRFFRAINSEELSKCFVSWIRSIVKPEHLIDQVIAIDGKTLRGSADGTHAAIHMVTAYATELRLVLCQEKVKEKSNEITAIPILLGMLEMRGAIITIDAMGTQKSIAKQIRDGGAHYILALKKNQENLHEETETFFNLEGKNGFKDVQVDTFTTLEKGHGRIEKRVCTVANVGNYISMKEDWEGLKSIVRIESEREIKGKKTKEVRYFITSLDMNAEKILEAIRCHWAIENSAHWVLDMTFGEDQSKIRKDNAPANIAVIRHFVLNFLNNAKAVFQKGTSLRRMRRMAGYQAGILDLIIGANF